MSNDKYLDHVYCHTSESQNLMRANLLSNGGIGAGGTVASQDTNAFIRETKKLRNIFMLNLDLLQEQDQRVKLKDKIIADLRAEVAALKKQSVHLEEQLQELQKQVRQTQRIDASSHSPPPLAKIQKQQQSVDLSECIVGFEMKKEQLKSGDNSASNQKKYMVQELGKTASQAVSEVAVGQQRKESSIIGVCDGKLISKIILHRVNTKGFLTASNPSASNSNSNSDFEEDHGKIAGNVKSCMVTHSEDSNDDSIFTRISQRGRVCKPRLQLRTGQSNRRCKSQATTPSPSNTVKFCLTPVTHTSSRGGKQMPLMLSHAPELQTDDSESCDSLNRLSQMSSSADSCTKSPPLKIKVEKPEPQAAAGAETEETNKRRYAHLRTTEDYYTREWEDEEEDEMQAINKETPTLEIPKWKEYEIPVCKGDAPHEDLDDETFLKRHAKLEANERKRKKWDVQLIREQRRVEKLRRRHCKDEQQQSLADAQCMCNSFYPLAESIERIQLTKMLPVQAFGEMVPKVGPRSNQFFPNWLDAEEGLNWDSKDFNLPTELQMPLSGPTKSAFQFVNKRNRRHSTSRNASVRRRRLTLTLSAQEEKKFAVA